MGHRCADLDVIVLEDLVFLGDDLIVDLISQFSGKRCKEAMCVFGFGFGCAGVRVVFGDGVVRRQGIL
jgi:hypothetical protein